METIKKFLSKLRKKSKPSYLSLWNGGTSGYSQSIFAVDEVMTRFDSKKVDERIDKKPVEVYQEIFVEEPKIDLMNLDAKIKMVKQRKEFLEKHFVERAGDEQTALAFLEARKKYEKGMFNWPATTQTKVDELCKKYKIREVNFEGYYKNIPMEAIDELEKFINAYEKVRSDNKEMNS